MARRLISSGSTFEKSIGYSRAVVDGDWVFVSGTTGFDYSNMTIQDDAVSQCEQALKNIAEPIRVYSLQVGLAARPRAAAGATGTAGGHAQDEGTALDRFKLLERVQQFEHVVNLDVEAICLEGLFEQRAPALLLA